MTTDQRSLLRGGERQRASLILRAVTAEGMDEDAKTVEKMRGEKARPRKGLFFVEKEMRRKIVLNN